MSAAIPAGPYTVTSKECPDGYAYFDVGATAAAAIAAGWGRGWWVTVALTPADANFDGMTRFFGVSGTRIYCERMGGGLSGLVSCGGTVTLSRQKPAGGYLNNKYSPNAGQIALGTWLQWDTSSGNADNDDQGMKEADWYIRPSVQARTAIHVGLNTAGADDGYTVVFGKKSVTAWQWLNDGHTVRRYSNGGNSHFDNSYVLIRHGFYSVGWASRGAYTSGGDYLAAAQVLAAGALGVGMPADGVFGISGGLNGNDIDTTRPAGLAAVPREPSALASGSTDNYSPGVGLTQWWAANAGGSTVTGMVAGVSGEMRYVHVTGGALTVSHESASSTAANRFTCNTGANIVAAAGSLLLMVYRPSTSRWYVTQLA